MSQIQSGPTFLEDSDMVFVNCLIDMIQPRIGRFLVTDSESGTHHCGGSRDGGGLLSQSCESITGWSYISESSCGYCGHVSGIFLKIKFFVITCASGFIRT